MSSFYGNHFDAALFNLREEFPHERSIRVVTVPAGVLKAYHCEATCGDATANRIRISRGLTLNDALDTLIHEYAHALQFRHNPRFRRFHSVEWGRFYARCYHAVRGD